MIVRSTSANHVELETEDALELLRIAKLLKQNPLGICKAVVIFIRQGIDEEDLYARFTAHAEARAREIDAQLDFTAP